MLFYPVKGAGPGTYESNLQPTHYTERERGGAYNVGGGDRVVDVDGETWVWKRINVSGA